MSKQKIDSHFEVNQNFVSWNVFSFFSTDADCQKDSELHRVGLERAQTGSDLSSFLTNLVLPIELKHEVEMWVLSISTLNYWAHHLFRFSHSSLVSLSLSYPAC